MWFTNFCACVDEMIELRGFLFHSIDFLLTTFLPLLRLLLFLRLLFLRLLIRRLLHSSSSSSPILGLCLDSPFCFPSLGHPISASPFFSLLSFSAHPFQMSPRISIRGLVRPSVGNAFVKINEKWPFTNSK